MKIERLNIAQIADKLMDLGTMDRNERLMAIPSLSVSELEALKQLQCATWDGNVISKSYRDRLWKLSLIDRWNGWQIVNRYGLCVLETLGLLDEDWQFKKNCGPHA